MDSKFRCRFLLVLTLVLSLGGCTRSGDEPVVDSSQIAAQVNGKDISIHQVHASIDLQPGLTERFGDKVYDRVLDGLIEQELAAQAGRNSGLDQSPKVVQAIELAKREVLARAYQDKLAASAGFPDEKAIEKYYDEHPELFSQRKQYELQETVLTISAEDARLLTERIEGVTSVVELNTLVRQSGFSNSVRSVTQWAESLPMDLLPELDAKRVGQSVAAIRGDGLVIFTILRAELSPLGLAQVRAAIRDALHSQYRKETLRRGMESLRQQAKIRKVGATAS